MGVFDFVKNAGKKLFGDDDEPAAAAPTTSPKTGPSIQEIREQALRNRIAESGVTVENLTVRFADGVCHVGGEVDSQEAREKVILACGNVQGVSRVEDSIEVDSPEAEATMYTVQSGDTLSGIAKKHYGNASKYMVIFEANKPLLSDPDKIYPGQVLRIPPLADQG